MPQSLSAVYIHLVFSTKNREPFLRDEQMRTRLHAELGGISKKFEWPPIITGGIEDHIHLLVRFGRTITQAEWVKELTRVSSLWLKEQFIHPNSQGSRSGNPVQEGATALRLKSY